MILRSFYVIYLIFYKILLVSITVTGAERLEKDHYRPVLGVKSHDGFFILHSEDLYPVKDSYPFGLGLEASWNYTSKKVHDQYLYFPRLGINAT